MASAREKRRSERDYENEIDELKEELEESKKKNAKLEKQNTRYRESAQQLEATSSKLAKLSRTKHCMVSGGKEKTKTADAKNKEYNVQGSCSHVVKGKDGKLKKCGNSASFYCDACLYALLR